MASWNIGINDVSEQTQALKNKLSSKDGHIAAQQSKLLKQAAEMDELQSALNDALHKLNCETKHVLRLEQDLKQCSEDLQNEKMTSSNVKAALAAAHDMARSKDLEARDLQSTIESLSHKSDTFSARNSKLEREKGTLEARVRELQANMRELSCPPVTPRQHIAVRPRSSSLSNFRITTLEQELNDVRTSLSSKEADLWAATQKLAQVQAELMKVDNEKLAMEKRLNMQLSDLQTSLEDKEDELEYLRAQQGDGSREAELLKRIEEDDAKIAALELSLGDLGEMKMVKEELKRTEGRLRIEIAKAEESDRRQIELVTEKEEALDELEAARAQITRSEDIASATEARTESLKSGQMVEDDPRHDEVETPALHDLPHGAEVVDIERLLAAIERLRMERDDLRRDIQFLETESKFAVEALEGKLAALTRPDIADNHSTDVAADRLGKRTEVFPEPSEGDGVEVHFAQLGLTPMAVAAVKGYVQSQVAVFADRTHDISARLEEKEQELRTLEEKYQAMEINLEVTLQCLAEVTSQVTQLESKDTERVEEAEKAKQAHEETKIHLEWLETQLTNSSKALEEAKSERDSLALQVTNLTTDVHSAQQELIEAESRYSSLQFRQLSTMSSNEATQALRAQIEELEKRVLRRTEQIGSHQHDIKRMETNLRLQEERLEEMTVELETMATQKEAMVEDCAAAREARDEAVMRVERLELDIEGLEGQLEERDESVVGLVSALMQTISRSREAIRVSDQKVFCLKDELCRLNTKHKTTARLLEEKTSELQQYLDTSEDAIRSTSRTVVEPRPEVKDEMKMLHERLEAEVVRTNSMAEQLGMVRCKADKCDELEKQIQDLQQALSTSNAGYHGVVEELKRANEQLQESFDEKESERMLARSDADLELDRLRTRHVTELSELQARLDQTLTALEEARRLCAISEASHRESLAELSRLKQELEDRLLTTSDGLLRGEQLHNELTRMKVEQSEEVGRLNERLTAIAGDAQRAKESHDELQRTHQGVVDKLARMQDEYEGHLSEAKKQLLTTQQLEDDLARVGSELAAKSQRSDNLVQEVVQLEDKLQEEVDKRAREREMHKEELHSASERHRLAESVKAKLHLEITTVQGQLEQANAQIESMRVETTALQVQNTVREAEGQRSISLIRFLESKVRENESTIVALEDSLQRTHAELCVSEQSGKSAEVNLSLQGAQHRRETSDLRREIAALRSRPNLETAVRELEERNNEMEELLRIKCKEIEDNDDRVLEMLKENKRLTAKVESLARKVQNLQTKLAAAKAAIPKATSEVVNAAPSSASAVMPVPSEARPRANTLASTTPTRVLLNRMASGPSSLPIPKTPERRAGLTPVFKARTPERQMGSTTRMTMPDPSPSLSLIGKKRRAPADFDESVPPQGFTVDSLPLPNDLLENDTPRVRRVLNSIHSGFTPMRNHTTRAMGSPSKVVPISVRSPFIADVTNSPARTVSHMATTHAAKTSKRSWLGKIRGVSSQTTGKMA